MDKEYKQIEGEFVIKKLREGLDTTNKFFVGSRELNDDDVVHLDISTLKSIINDAKIGVI